MIKIYFDIFLFLSYNQFRRCDMKKHMFNLFLLMFIVLNIGILYGQTKELVFYCEDQEDYPNVIGAGDQIKATEPGVAIEVIQLLEKKLNLKIQIKRGPWKRILEVDLKNGTANGVFTASYKPEREEFGVYPKKDGKIDESRRYSSITYSFYKLKKTSIAWDGNNFQNFTGSIDAPRGYSIVEDLRKKGYNVEESPSTSMGFKKLMAGRVSLVAALESSGDHLLSKDKEALANIQKIEPPIVSKPYYFMLSKQFVAQNPELAEKIWSTLKEIREKDMKKISAKYFKE